MPKPEWAGLPPLRGSGQFDPWADDVDDYMPSIPPGGASEFWNDLQTDPASWASQLGVPAPRITTFTEAKEGAEVTGTKYLRDIASSSGYRSTSRSFNSETMGEKDQGPKSSYTAVSVADNVG